MTKNIFITALVAVLATVVTVKVMVPTGGGQGISVEAKEESTYERVMRTGEIRCGYNMWPPYKDRDINTGEEIGIDIEVSKEFEKITDLKFKFIEVALGQNVEDLNSGKIDAMCGTGPWQLSQIKYIDFSQPAYFAPVYIYVRGDETRFNTLGDLNTADVTFVGIDGDLSADLKNRLFPKAKASSLPQMAQSSQLLLDVALSKADATIYDPQAAKDFNKNNESQVKPLFEEPLAVYGIGFSVRKGEKDMLNLFNSGINIMKDIGVIRPILRRYDPDSVFLLEAQNNYKSN